MPFWSADMNPHVCPIVPGGNPPHFLTPLGEGGPEDEHCPEAAPTQIADVMAISDPFWETPQGQTKFDLAKWGMVLPPMGEEVSPHLSAKEIKRIARAVHTADFSGSQNVRVNPIFVSKDVEEDPRVESFREALHRDYDGAVIRSDLPPRKDHPDRGPYGYAYIPLVPNPIPQRQKCFRLQGERLEAHKKVTQDWADHWFIERPPRELIWTG